MSHLMEIINRISEIKNSMAVESRCSAMPKYFAESICNLHKSNPSFYNHIFKGSRMNALSVLMNFLFSGEVSTLSDFYSICENYGYSGKNNAISLVEFLIHTNRLKLIKGKDRRTKTPEITSKGLADLNAIMRALVQPLTIYDPEITEEIIQRDGYYKSYYQRASSLIGFDHHSFDTEKYTSDIYSKSGGLVFLLLIYLDVINGKIAQESKIRKSYFSNLSFDLGVSSSHVNNLIQALVYDKIIYKSGKDYIIKNDFVSDVETFSFFYMATIYYLVSNKF